MTDYPLPNQQRGLFVHPQRLLSLISTELLERFSHYSISVLSIAYLGKYILVIPALSEGMIGLTSLREVLERIHGPLSAEALAGWIFPIYFGGSYLAPLFGGVLADRVLGREKTTALGLVLIASGNVMLTSPRFFLLALLVLIVGTGLFKANLQAQVGSLYEHSDLRLQQAFSIFYVGTNIGALCAFLLGGIFVENLGDEKGWLVVCVAAAIAMIIAFIHYSAASSKTEAYNRPRVIRERGNFDPPFDNRVRISLALSLLASALFWAVYVQQIVGMTWWSYDVDRSIDLILWKLRIPKLWFQALNPLMIIAFTPILLSVWSRFAKRGREITESTKMFLGCLFLFSSNCMMAFVAQQNERNLVWVLFYYVLNTLGELCFAPILLAHLSRLAPDQARSTTMAMWSISLFFGSIFSGPVSTFWSPDTHSFFFQLLACISIWAAMLSRMACWVLEPESEPERGFRPKSLFEFLRSSLGFDQAKSTLKQLFEISPEAGSTPSTNRQINVWIEDGVPPLEIKRTYQFGINIGRQREQALAVTQFHEPKSQKDALDLLVVVSGTGLVIEPPQQILSLPMNGDTDAIFVKVRAVKAVNVMLRISFYLSHELTLLQEFEIPLTVMEVVTAT